MQKMTPFFMFEGQAEQAINFYTSVFKNSSIVSLTRYAENEDGVKDSVKLATFILNGQEFMAIDSYVNHAFAFTPAISIFVQCETREEIDALYAKLSQGGQVYMPLDHYGFSQRFGWVGDPFGITWQLNLI